MEGKKKLTSKIWNRRVCVITLHDIDYLHHVCYCGCVYIYFIRLIDNTILYYYYVCIIYFDKKKKIK